jgi:uncharacterized protein (TIGR03435 family)
MARGMVRGVLFVVAATGIWAADEPVFDVASVKASAPVLSGQNININLGTARNGEVTLGNATLSECIRFAYGLVGDEQLLGPEWIRNREVRFDIDAKAPADTLRERLLVMTQNLLAERFHLVLHREQKTLPHLEMGVAKNGPKLRASDEASAAGRLFYGRGWLTYYRVTMHTLAVLLSRQLRQTVLDKTGIEGSFDVNLEWTPDDPQAVARAADGTDANDLPLRPDIFTAMQVQLGLKLEMRKTPLEVLVVDRADKVPVAN